MNLKRFTGRTSREALALVRQQFGQDAVVMSTRPCPEGIEVLAMAPESLQQIEKLAAPTVSAAASTRPVRAQAAAAPQRTDGSVDQDVEQLAMSTLSFQDYVRERMLKRRRSELASEAGGDALPEAPGQPAPRPAAPVQRTIERDAFARAEAPTRAEPRARSDAFARHDGFDVEALSPRVPVAPAYVEPMTPAVPRRAPASEYTAVPATHADATPRRDQQEMLAELRSMRGLIEQRFGALAFMEKLQRQPRQATLAQKLLDCGFSPSLIRKLMEGLPAEGDETEWAAGILQRNLPTGENEPALEDIGGVYALIGSTGVGKTTSTAKLAAAFASRHGAANLGLITLDAYRIAAHEQLRAYGRILGVPVHTAHDRASLEDLLELLAGKKMVLIDTAGMAQRDSRTKELMEMLSHRSINRLLVVNAAQQGETIEDVLVSYRAAACRGVILSKIDEAMKLGPALDALIRHKIKVLAVANGQRVPEDWHRLSAHALVQRALRGGGNPAWKLDTADVNLVFAAQNQQPPASAAAMGAAR